MKIAFDVDGTLITFEDKPRYDVINLLATFYRMGCEIYVWSGGGIEYAEQWCRKLGIENMVEAVIEKGQLIGPQYEQIDLAIDDEHTNLGKVNMKV